MWSQTKQLLKETIESITPARKVEITTGDQAIQHIATELSLEPEVVKKALLFQKPSNSFTVQTDDLLQEVVEETAPRTCFPQKVAAITNVFYSGLDRCERRSRGICCPFRILACWHDYGISSGYWRSLGILRHVSGGASGRKIQS